MKLWALIHGGKVSEVVEQDSRPSDAWVEITGQHVGPGYAYADGTFSPPVPIRHITQFAFRQRFTQAERVAIEIASLDDPTAAAPARQQAAALRVGMGDLAQAKYVDLDHASVTDALSMLEAFGLIAAGRAQEIKDREVAEAERP